ncbi:MAG: protein translocase subunit SecF [Acidimicrobiia bacterium]
MTSAATTVAPKRERHTLGDFYHERTHFNFIDRSWRWAILSGTLVLISVVAFAVQGLNLGIDFEGGTQWQFTRSNGSASVSDVRDALNPLGLGDARVLILGDDSVRVQSEDLSPAKQGQISAALAKYAGIDTQQVLVKNVGPTWGDKVSSKALQALVVFFVVIAIYLTFRFEWRMALAAIIAVIHDIIITVGVYAITQFEVVPATVVAFLTILGYSLYDTVVVFDKVRDNQARLGTERGDTFSAMVNRSLNQVLMRSINTSLVAVLPVASLLIVGTYVFGGLVLRDFALALFVGLTVGAYSSIFGATPVLAWLKEREPRYRALRERAAADLAKRPVQQAAPPPELAEPAPVLLAAEVDERVDIDDTEDVTARATITTAPPPTATASSPSKSRSPSASPSAPGRGGSNPRPRQQRGKKRR